mmetsp:Transcript_2409/g.5395  ORF Transcript_2409/g.5395 Transcript_2409/m.5395 type:complete len:384 (+) Transcript_2409:189-1340(+)
MQTGGTSRASSWLLALFHSLTCNACPCAQPELCSATKTTIRHMLQCRGCEESTCGPLRKLLLHYINCKDSNCELCAPVLLQLRGRPFSNDIEQIRLANQASGVPSGPLPAPGDEGPNEMMHSLPSTAPPERAEELREEGALLYAAGRASEIPQARPRASLYPRNALSEVTGQPSSSAPGSTSNTQPPVAVGQPGTSQAAAAAEPTIYSLNPISFHDQQMYQQQLSEGQYQPTVPQGQQQYQQPVPQGPGPQGLGAPGPEAYQASAYRDEPLTYPESQLVLLGQLLLYSLMAKGLDDPEPNTWSPTYLITHMLSECEPTTCENIKCNCCRRLMMHRVSCTTPRCALCRGMTACFQGPDPRRSAAWSQLDGSLEDLTIALVQLRF